MRTIQVDDDVYGELERRVSGFGDTPNLVMRRLLKIGSKTPISPSPQSVVKKPQRDKGKAQRTNLKALVSVGSLKEGQALYIHDYQGNRLQGVEATVRGDKLEFNGEIVSMSALTRTVMQDRGYQNTQYRGPKFWFTAEGKSVMELWDEYLKAGVR